MATPPLILTLSLKFGGLNKPSSSPNLTAAEK